MQHNLTAEYKTLLAEARALQQRLDVLPTGYISKKTINGKNYYYLQSRKSGRIVSQYLKQAEVEDMIQKIKERKSALEQKKQIVSRIKQLEQAAKLLGNEVSRELLFLKLTDGMDLLSESQKARSVSFADSLNAIEGVPITADLAQGISDWVSGERTFSSLFEDTLKKYYRLGEGK